MLNKIKDIFVLGVLLILAIWLSPFILVGAVIYLIYRIRKAILRKRLLEQIKQEWFSKGRHIFFLYSDSKKWKEYFEQKLVPKIQDKAVIWNWSTRQKDGWNENLIEAKIMSLFRPMGFFYPMAVVFLPSGDVKIFQFYLPYVNKIKSGKDDYNKMEKEFLALVQSIEKKKK